MSEKKPNGERLIAETNEVQSELETALRELEEYANLLSAEVANLRARRKKDD